MEDETVGALSNAGRLSVIRFGLQTAFIMNWLLRSQKPDGFQGLLIKILGHPPFSLLLAHIISGLRARRHNFKPRSASQATL